MTNESEINRPDPDVLLQRLKQKETNSIQREIKNIFRNVCRSR